LCLLSLGVRTVHNGQPYTLVAIKNFYMEKTPKIGGYMYQGVVIK